MGSNAKQAALSVVEVPFHGDTLHAVQEGDSVYVSIRRVCEALGIQTTRQISKLRAEPWAVVHEMCMTGPDGRNYDTSCISLDSLPMWLAGIKSGKVREEVRPKLIAYQKECARVLRDYFFRGGAVNPRATESQLEELSKRIDQVLGENRTLVSSNEKLVATVDDLTRDVWALRNELDTGMGTIGKQGARHLSNRIARIVDMTLGPSATKQERKSANEKIQQQCRAVARYPKSKSCSLENYPRSAMPLVKVMLDALEANANVSVKQRAAVQQLTLDLMRVTAKRSKRSNTAQPTKASKTSKVPKAKASGSKR